MNQPIEELLKDNTALRLRTLLHKIEADVESTKKFEAEYVPGIMEPIYELLMLGYSCEDVAYASEFHIESVESFKFLVTIVRLDKGAATPPDKLCKLAVRLSEEIRKSQNM